MLAAKNAGENSPPLDQQDQQSATKTRVSLQERGVYNSAIYISLPSQRDNHVLIATNNFHILSIHVNPIDCSVLAKKSMNLYKLKRWTKHDKEEIWSADSECCWVSNAGFCQVFTVGTQSLSDGRNVVSRNETSMHCCWTMSASQLSMYLK